MQTSTHYREKKNIKETHMNDRLEQLILSEDQAAADSFRLGITTPSDSQNQEEVHYISAILNAYLGRHPLLLI